MAGVIVPLYPGVFSAIGLLMSDVKHDYIQSKLTPLHDATPEELNGLFARLAAQAHDELRHDGFAPGRIRVERSLDMRYGGQGYEIAVPCPAEPLTTAGLKQLRTTFDRQHDIMFGHMAPEEPVEIVSYRVRGRRSRAADRAAEVQTSGHPAFRCTAEHAARAVRRQGRSIAPSMSASGSMSACSLPGPRSSSSSTARP